MRYKFELQFNQDRAVDVESISQLLDQMTKVTDNASAELLTTLMAISETSVHDRSAELNEVIKQMLRMLAVSGECYALYHLKARTYTLARTREAVEPMMVGPYYLIGIEEDEREFVCYWGEGYEPRTPKTVGLGWFCNETGYSTADQSAITELHIGEAFTFQESGFHSVVRVK